MPDGEDALLSSQSIKDFFRDLLQRAMRRQNAQVQPFTELYLVNLLHEYLLSDHLYVQDPDGSWHQKPLAFLLKEALEEEGPTRLFLLKRLGDTSLFVSGFFPDSISGRKSLVNVDYYIQMGGRAYDAVARAQRQGLWDELAEKFRLLVDLLNEVSDRTLASTNAGLVKLYERWLRNGQRGAFRGFVQ